MDISLDFVVDAARRRLATLTPEVAGYVVLLAARELEFRPRGVSAESLALAEGGEVHVRETAPASAEDVESSLRGVLATLVALAPWPAPAISAVAERTDRTGLSAFAAELAAALIPINHAAAHRALARLYRESQRARLSGQVDRGEAAEEAVAPEAQPAPAEVRAAPPRLAPTALERPREPEPLEIDVDLGSYPPAAAASLMAPGEPVAPLARSLAMAPEPSERFPEPFALAAIDNAPGPVAVALEPFALAEIELETEPAPIVVALEPFALAALEDHPAPVAVGLDPSEALPEPEWAPSGAEEPVTGAPAWPTPTEVVVPVPIIGLPSRERALVVPMAIIEANAPVAGMPEPRASEATSASVAEPQLAEQRIAEPPRSIDTLSQSGFARVSWPSLPPANEDLDIEDCRSDVQQLLAAFIAEARSEQQMTRGLRRMLGLSLASSERARIPLR